MRLSQGAPGSEKVYALGAHALLSEMEMYKPAPQSSTQLRVGGTHAISVPCLAVTETFEQPTQRPRGPFLAASPLASANLAAAMLCSTTPLDRRPPHPAGDLGARDPERPLHLPRAPEELVHVGLALLGRLSRHPRHLRIVPPPELPRLRHVFVGPQVHALLCPFEAPPFLQS